MPTDTSLQALREANPRNRPDFDPSPEHFDALRRQIVETPLGAPTRSRHPVRRRRLIGLSATAAAIALALVVVSILTLGGTSAPSAYAAAKKALAATAAASSGTITGSVSHNGASVTLNTTQWNGDSITVTRGDTGDFGPNQALTLIDGDAYVEQADGTWLHYSSESGVGPKVGPEGELAHNNVAGTTAGQILSLATGLTQVSQSDGTTVYTGTIPNLNTDPGVPSSDDTILRIIANLRAGNDAIGPHKMAAPPGFHGDLRMKMTVGADDLVRQISLTIQQQDTGTATTDGAYTWTVTYSQLGTTPSITAPATSTPTPPVVWSSGTPCTTPCGG